MTKPRIAVILDENTSTGGTRYEAAKGYFQGIGNAGGMPFGVPYLPDLVDVVINEFDGVLSVGGRFAYPETWYLPGQISLAPRSDRLAVERAMVEGMLAADKPVLGICAGMQMLACLQGCRLTHDLRATVPEALDHDRHGVSHKVEVTPGSRLAALVGWSSIEVNSFHREAVVEVDPSVMVSARAVDGVVEAIEVPSRRFALGIQWHQELLVERDHPGNAIFRGFVDAADQGRPSVRRT